MAKRRMISLDIYDSDDFLEMPSESQNLFSHLTVRADDDGFVSNPKRIRRMLGYGENVFDVLLGKGYVLAFKTGYVVITDWPTMNRVEPSKKTITNAKYEKAQLRSINKRYELDENADTSILEDVSRNILESRQFISRKILEQGRLGKVSLVQVKDDDEYNQSLEIQKSAEAFPKTTIAELLDDNPQVEGLVNDLFSDLIVDNPDQAFEAINAVVSQYWRLRTLLDDGNEVLNFKEKVHGKDKGILAVIKEAAEAQLEYMKPRLANFNMFGRYFENGLIDRVNTAISSGGISNGN
ncbi:hypothetical protein ACJQWY_02355 [Weissella kandleri]|uniref:hypothetical protein n=1 Tax=Weissella kandleri TaxID=1616 RepID=UPI00387E51D2